MTLNEAMGALKRKGSAQVRKIWRRHGAKEPMFGVKFADLYALRKRIGSDGALAEALWKTRNADARNLALLIADPGTAPLARWGRELDWSSHAGLLADLAAKTPQAAKLQKAWTASKSDLVASAGWATLCGRLRGKLASESDGRAALKAIEQGIHAAPNRTRHAMNMALCGVGIWMPALRKEALAAAARIGKVEVDHGETGCKTPDAAAYIAKAVQRERTSR